MELNKTNIQLFELIKSDLEARGAKVKVLAYLLEKSIDYTLFAEFPTGRKWEINKIIL